MKLSNRNLITLVCILLISCTYIISGLILKEDITYTGFGFGMFSALFIYCLAMYFFRLWDFWRIDV